MRRPLVCRAVRGKFGNWWHSERARKRRAEIGDIVLGVLIALALGAVATWIGWRIDVANARASIADELGEIAGQGQLRERAYPCVEAKLDQIAALLDAADRQGRLPPIGTLGEPHYMTWSRGVWDSVVGSDTAGHMGRDELDNLSGAYEFVDIIRSHTQLELEAWTRLYVIVGPGRAIGADELAELRAALSTARVANRRIAVAGMRTNQIVRAFDLPANPETVREYAGAPVGPFCAPISKPDGRPYGQAPQENSLARVRANPITRNAIGAWQR